MPLLSSAATTVVHAKPTAMRMPLITSGSVAGTMTPRIVCSRFAPSARAALIWSWLTPCTPLTVEIAMAGKAARKSSQIFDVSPMPNHTMSRPM